MFNCLLLVSTDSTDGESLSSELHHLICNQDIDQNKIICLSILGLVDETESMLVDSRQATSVEIIKSILYNGFAKVIKILLERHPQEVLEADDEDEILPVKQLLKIIQFC